MASCINARATSGLPKLEKRLRSRDCTLARLQLQLRSGRRGADMGDVCPGQAHSMGRLWCRLMASLWKICLIDSLDHAHLMVNLPLRLHWDCVLHLPNGKTVQCPLFGGAVTREPSLLLLAAPPRAGSDPTGTLPAPRRSL